MTPHKSHEVDLRGLLDGALLNISRKYTKKFGDAGYTSFGEIAQDLADVVPVLETAPPYIAIQYLLQIISDVTVWLCAFPQDQSLFETCARLDQALVRMVPSVDQTAKVRILNALLDARRVTAQEYDEKWAEEASVMYAETVASLGEQITAR
jgi:glutamate mutase epsilon subunit